MGWLKIFGSYVNANYSTTSFAAYAHNWKVQSFNEFASKECILVQMASLNANIGSNWNWCVQNIRTDKKGIYLRDWLVQEMPSKT